VSGENIIMIANLVFLYLVALSLIHDKNRP